MQFISISFYLFLLIIVATYYILPSKFRNYLILGASYYFYFSIQPEYVVLLIVSTLFNYYLGRGLEYYRAYKNWLLGLGLAFNLGFLFFFKYFNFFSDEMNAVFSMCRITLEIPHHSLLLPIGISFYTFMALGYILDVYWGDIKSQKNLLTFSVYLAFFPQILCGPIGRAKNLFKQFEQVHPFLYDNLANGFRLILWGLFKKMVVADNIGAYVNAIYDNVPMHTTLTLLFATLLYPLQLYADFGGYTDIARGVGKLLGFDLMVNFRTPYVNSTSVTDYWKRNHISLTSWLKDYVFFPFMGTSTSKGKIYLGIVIMFLASGFWHGVGWMFLIWGLIQAVCLIIEDYTGWDKKFLTSRFMIFWKKLFTYVVVSFGLLFFRLPSLSAVKTYIHNLLGAEWSLYTGDSSTITMIFTGIIILISIELALNKKQFDQWIADHSWAVRWFVYLPLSLIILLIGVLDGKAFIYFQF